MKVDFLNATKKVAIEVNGPQHDSFNSFFHKKSRLNYLKSIKRDYQKAKWLELNEYTLIELSTEEVNGLSEDFLVKNMKILI
jgi:very-short-patch-repair endonuclease